MCIFDYSVLYFTIATTVQPPVITATARYPRDPTTVSVVWDSASADVIDINVYYGSTFNRVCIELCMVLLA